MRKTLIVGNWKMHLNASQSSLLVHRLHERIAIHPDVEVVLAPSMLVLQPLSLQIDRRKFRLAAQNAYFKDEGAFTGEVSFSMLRDLVHYVIVGHSERRRYFHENLETVRDKVAAAIRNDIQPILCIGETKHEREDSETNQVLHDQLQSALSNLTPEQISQVVIAYEPVWAIGQVTAKPTDVEAAIKTIRKYLNDSFGAEIAEAVHVLYGGDVLPDVAGGLLAIAGVDGFLVGHASLNYYDFSEIVKAAHRRQHQGEEK